VWYASGALAGGGVVGGSGASHESIFPASVGCSVAGICAGFRLQAVMAPSTTAQQMAVKGAAFLRDWSGRHML
jgi:hypothetical protein